MKLGLIVNCVGNDHQCGKLTYELLDKIYPYFEKVNIEVSLLMPNSDWTKTQADKHVNTLTLQDPENVKRLLSRNNKGVIVRHSLELLKEEDCKIILHIDGSGSFYMADINAVVGLMTEPLNHAVLTVRDISGMDLFRTQIEQFERKLISSQFKDVLIEDGQSGCWSFRFFDDFQPEKDLSAGGYEIELDILINLLKHNATIVWHPIKINYAGRSKSQYKMEDGINKLIWLAGKLELRKDEILSELDKFIIQKSLEITSAEIESEKLGKPENKIKNYRKLIVETNKLV